MEVNAASDLPTSFQSASSSSSAQVPEPARSSKGSRPDKPKSLEAQVDLMADQLSKLMSSYEDQSKALQTVWGMDLNLRQLEKDLKKTQTETKPSPVAEPAFGNRFAQMQAMRK